MYKQKNLRPIRRHVRFDVSIKLYQGWLEAIPRDISIGGMYVLVRDADVDGHPPEPGTALKVAFALPDIPKEISSAAEVVWAFTDDRDFMGYRACGLGLRFVGMSKESLELVKGFIGRFKFLVVAVDEDRDNLEFLRGCLNDENLQLIMCSTAAEALQILKSQEVAAIIIGKRVDDAEELTRRVTRRFPHSHTKAIVMLDREVLKGGWESVGVPGVFQHVWSHAGELPVRQIVRNALEAYEAGLNQEREQQHVIREQSEKISYLEEKAGEVPGFELLVGEHPEMLKTVKSARDVSTTDATVLIQGESGTGKELLARGIHRVSERSEGSFVAVNCGAIPPDLLESELFGHTKGAFTGAVRSKRGKIQAAGGGTLFLDEIGDLPLPLQVKLLRVLEEKMVTPLGSNKPEAADIRILAASNKNLEEETKAGRFRDDLYYRIAVVVLHLPPLRERRGDVRILANKFLADFCKEYRRRIRGFEPEALELLEHFNWPGNVRELKNQIERVVVMCSDAQVVPAEMISEDIRSYVYNDLSCIASNPESHLEVLSGNFTKVVLRGGVSVREASDHLRRAAIEGALRECNGSKTKAAGMLGISRTTMIGMMKRLNIS
ncbi:sigma 54-interacting transcriptional regulator [Myxococcota bacterium]